MKVKLLYPHSKKPVRATPGSAAFDCFVADRAADVIPPGKSKKISLGFKLEVDWGLAAYLLPRSGLATKEDVVLKNLIGLIDSDYREEVFAVIHNRSDDLFHIIPDMRICQMVIGPVVMLELEVVDELSETSRKGGFGSTGH